MILPNNKIEKGLLQENRNSIIIGLDEAGRGPLAGPVVAAAAWVRPEILSVNFSEKKLIRDSKKLSYKQRVEVSNFIQQNKDFLFGIGEVDNYKIDQINILNATFLAMRLAIDKLKIKMEKLKMKEIENFNKIILLVDGNKKIPKIKIEQKVFPRGDQNIFSIAVASICAKVYRDKLMDELDKKYPIYGFNHHRGYGTQLHYARIKKYGICEIHRRSFNLGI